uniref:Uncharacterized protein n=1 Tax=Anguilla anguilla TaxID=7936 RepID=A0A0E9VA07_ANGAN
MLPKTVVFIFLLKPSLYLSSLFVLKLLFNLNEASAL